MPRFHGRARHPGRSEAEIRGHKPEAIVASSAVGAGDSFLGAMIFAHAKGWAPQEALRLGLAAGAAAVPTPGTAPCGRKDAKRFYAETGQGERIA
ncbi:PfkB family carbohydrate kinase [Bosea psychrotolerans]|nr:PfkB family carbohydrate kinase [Bosea psychrotolerans]